MPTSPRDYVSRDLDFHLHRVAAVQVHHPMLLRGMPRLLRGGAHVKLAAAEEVERVHRVLRLNALAALVALAAAAAALAAVAALATPRAVAARLGRLGPHAHLAERVDLRNLRRVEHTPQQQRGRLVRRRRAQRRHGLPGGLLLAPRGRSGAARRHLRKVPAATSKSRRDRK